MIRLLVSILVSGLIGVATSAQESKPSADEKGRLKNQELAPSLKVGDPAPAVKADKWLQGEPVTEFKPGNVYVVEFWATWCGPCIASMPHVAQLQAQYRDRGVTFIGFSAGDPNNSEEKVVAFVKKRGPRLGYTFAYAQERTTYDAWMTAAGRTGIPCAFVVDKAGRITYIGHPIYLGVVLPRVLALDATPRSVSEEVAKIEEESHAVSAALARDPKSGLKAVTDFEARYPAMENIWPFVRAKLSQLPRFGRPGEAKEFAEAMVARGIEQGDPFALGMVSSILRLGDGKESKELLVVAVKAAEARLQMTGDKDASALIDLASSYFVAGNKAHAKEYARKAVAAAAGESIQFKQYVEQQTKKIEDDKK
jgi:thiol-disulfide isomerase/thioredoxin